MMVYCDSLGQRERMIGLMVSRVLIYDRRGLGVTDKLSQTGHHYEL